MWNDLMKELSDVLLQVVLPLLMAGVAAAVFKVAREYAAHIRSERLRSLLLDLVNGAEAKFADVTVARGARKMQFVVEAAREAGFRDVQVAQVEAAVRTMKATTGEIKAAAKVASRMRGNGDGH